MGIAANKFRLLYLTGQQSDTEYKISLIFQRRKSLMDQMVQIASTNANNIFQTDQNSDISSPNPLPGTTYPLPGITLPPADSIPTGDYEEQTAVLHEMDKALEMEAKSIEPLIETAKTEIDVIHKLLQKNIERDYKTFANS